MPGTPGGHPGSSAVGILQRFVSGTHVALATYSMVDVEASFLPLSPTRLQLPGAGQPCGCCGPGLWQVSDNDREQTAKQLTHGPSEHVLGSFFSTD